ncbi:hypothetical protein AXF42_Ash006093 [Apostasia shenzhenica]|uniref:Uncharacterized protein n=1 Tax=Apostasia shenzhenica TaxID=1088818 RepID=A0A2I0B076_9ASPA|nr:hypothetical protein AXF42_Ash006093 [Apostasia shenzhenica]
MPVKSSMRSCALCFARAVRRGHFGNSLSSEGISSTFASHHRVPLMPVSYRPPCVRSRCAGVDQMQQ